MAFFLGLIIGGLIVFATIALIAITHDDQDYIELNYYEENEKEKKNEVEE